MLRVELLLGFLGLFAVPAAADTYFAPRPDLRVALPLSSIITALRALEGTRYEGSGGACRDDFYVKLNALNPSARGIVDLLDGSAAFELQLGLTAEGDYYRGICDVFDVKVNCDIRAKLGDLTFPVTGAGTCDIDIHSFAADGKSAQEESEAAQDYAEETEQSLVNFDFTIDPLLQLPADPVIHLKPSDSTQPEFVELTFGSYVQREWRPSETPLERRMLLTARALGLGGTNHAIDPCCAKEVVTVDPQYMVADMLIGHANSVTEPDSASAMATLERGLTTGGSTAVILEIAATAFGQVRGDGVQDGLFGTLLPLKIAGRQRIDKGYYVTYEIIASGARAGFGSKGGNDYVGVELELSDWKVWLSKTAEDRGAPAKIKRVLASAMLDLPRVTASGRIETAVREFTIQFDCTFGSVKGCFKVPNFASSLNAGTLDLGSIRSEVVIALPECIRFSSNKFKPKKRCSQSDSARPGAISNSTPNNVGRIKLHLDQIQGGLIDAGRAVQYRIPVSNP